MSSLSSKVLIDVAIRVGSNQPSLVGVRRQTAASGKRVNSLEALQTSPATKILYWTYSSSVKNHSHLYTWRSLFTDVTKNFWSCCLCIIHLHYSSGPCFTLLPTEPTRRLIVLSTSPENFFSYVLRWWSSCWNSIWWDRADQLTFTHSRDFLIRQPRHFSITSLVLICHVADAVPS